MYFLVTASPPTAPAEMAEALLSVVEVARGGDRAAFARLFRRYERMVHGILLVKVRPAEAEDLVQDVFLAALERLPTLEDPAAFGGWLAQIARNRVVDHYRRRRATEPLDDEHPEPHPGADRVEAERVLGVIRSLPEAYQETLILRLVEGMTGPEIAAQVGLTPESVRVNLHRGMKQLRERLGREQP